MVSHSTSAEPVRATCTTVAHRRSVMKDVLEKILLTLERGCPTKLHLHMLNLLSWPENRIPTRAALLEIGVGNAANYLTQGRYFFETVNNVFRRTSDHPLSPFMDLANVTMNSTLQAVMGYLQVPLPDTSRVLLYGGDRLEPVWSHLLQVVLSRESQIKCLEYMTKLCHAQTPEVVEGVLDGGVEIFKACVPDEYIEMVHTANAIEIGYSHEAANRLLQLCMLCGATDSVSWILDTMPFVPVSRGTAMIAAVTDFASVQDRGVHSLLNFRELMWLLRFCQTSQLERCLKRNCGHITSAEFQLAFRLCLDNNSLTVLTADFMLMQKLVKSGTEEMMSMARYSNLPMIVVLITRARSWNPSTVLEELRAGSRWGEGENHLEIAKWIAEYLNKTHMQIAVEGDPQKLCSYKAMVGVVRAGGLRERSCKVVPMEA